MSEKSRVIHYAAPVLKLSKRQLYRRIDEIGIEELRFLTKKHVHDKLLPAKDAAKMLQTSISSIYRLFHEGEMPGIVLFGTTVRFRAEDVINQAEQNITK